MCHECCPVVSQRNMVSGKKIFFVLFCKRSVDCVLRENDKVISINNRTPRTVEEAVDIIKVAGKTIVVEVTRADSGHGEYNQYQYQQQQQTRFSDDHVRSSSDSYTRSPPGTSGNPYVHGSTGDTSYSYGDYQRPGSDHVDSINIQQASGHTSGSHLRPPSGSVRSRDNVVKRGQTVNTSLNNGEIINC